MSAGRPPKPDALHKLNGTHSIATGAATANYTGAESPIRCTKPRMSLHIKADPECAADWREMVRTLKERGTLTRADAPLIEMYCERRKQKREALKHLDDEGLVREYTRMDSNGVERATEKQNLWWKIAQDCDRQILAALDRLGVGPVMKDKPKPSAKPVADVPKVLTPEEAYMQRVVESAQQQPSEPEAVELPEVEKDGE